MSWGKDSFTNSHASHASHSKVCANSSTKRQQRDDGVEAVAPLRRIHHRVGVRYRVCLQWLEEGGEGGDGDVEEDEAECADECCLGGHLGRSRDFGKE